MRIAVPTNGGGREDTVAPVFARAPAFYIADVDENGNIVSEKVIQNSAAMVGGGAGPMAVQTLINEGVEAIIAPQVGPNAFGAIQAAGIKLYQVAPGTPVEDAIKSVVSGRASQFTAPAPQAPVAPVTPVTPATPVAPAAPVYPAYPAYGFGYGWGRGWGRGRGFGRGWGRGGRGWGARLGYCPWTGMPSRRALRWYYGWW
ncbi:NifB/NifX family molybdenum-iron cluster-binding protein [Thermococcus alcaliphilus]|uniref:NifB/NifX family molybdenum-iron cluster-binding protein n=1 Tax=Thermococcus alcaliphilus TaxID=139207 RepID=UPI002091B8E6|nr:NifB/NifX family molybdenum-iron cluster-binding protein [Thermococcus alcaliphilus]MCO6041408.1 NifB/NifX family molybdenum-iron cluster-binding protein [Thermococcus alcaliphilus]